MKKVFITGITGTVAPYIKQELENNDYVVFDKHFHINDNDFMKVSKYLNKIKPSVILHLALGPIAYSKMLASYAKENDILFLYVSTVSVFEDNNGGPYTINDKIHVKNEYGKYKYENELAIIDIKHDAFIVRIGWQISEIGDASSNNMFHFIKEQSHQGVIKVSDKFYPSTSFLVDTAKAVVDILMHKKPDLYLVNSNEDMSLYDIIKKLNIEYNLNLKVEIDDSFARNDIMIDPRVSINKFRK